MATSKSKGLLAHEKNEAIAQAARDLRRAARSAQWFKTGVYPSPEPPSDEDVEAGRAELASTDRARLRSSLDAHRAKLKDEPDPEPRMIYSKHAKRRKAKAEAAKELRAERAAASAKVRAERAAASAKAMEALEELADVDALASDP